MVAGDSIGGFNSASVQSVNTPVGGAAQTVDEMPDGLAYVGSFTVKDNATCAPNNPPLAALTATPGSGTAPLAVNFDASGSRDPDAGDAIASYIFEFGDGSPAVSQATPSVSHTYATAGDYKASVTATDTHGASSRNAAESVIELQSCFDDADAHIAYDKGWHTVKDADASAGGLHLLQADSGQHGLSFVFDLGSAQGTFDYFFATSQKGGKADLYLDGAFVKTVSYAGNAGSLHQPVSGGRAEFPVAGRGSHTLELRNLSGAAYVDQLCIAGSSLHRATHRRTGQDHGPEQLARGGPASAAERDRSRQRHLACGGGRGERPLALSAPPARSLGQGAGRRELLGERRRQPGRAGGRLGRVRRTARQPGHRPGADSGARPRRN